MKICRAFCACVTVAFALRAQAPAFDVASVRPSQDTSAKMSIRRDPGGGITFVSANLKTLVLMAYNIQGYQLTGAEGWMESERYDVIAKAPVDGKKSDTWRMLQALLAQRFQLRTRRDVREMPAYELVEARGGLKVHETERAPSEADGGFRTAKGRFTCWRAGLDTLAFALSDVLGRRVLDRTGIQGKFDLTLEWSDDGPTLFTAVQEQLGLRLEASKAQVGVVIIERAERPSAN